MVKQRRSAARWALLDLALTRATDLDHAIIRKGRPNVFRDVYLETYLRLLSSFVHNSSCNSANVQVLCSAGANIDDLLFNPIILAPETYGPFTGLA